MKKMALYLGLAPDEEFEEYDDDIDDRRARPAPSMAAARPATTVAVRSQPSTTSEAPAVSSVRPIPVPSAEPSVSTVTATVRPVQKPSTPAIARPSIVTPESFGDAPLIADRFKMNQPVAMNLKDVDRQLMRRLIDFASGLCYGLSGSLQRLSSHVFLLTPDGVEVPQEEQRRLAKLGE
jgi:cell division inhibitor SepF